MKRQSVLHPVLSKRNTHERDCQLVFDEPTHKYSILCDPDSNYTSVTTWNHSHFPEFNADAIIDKMMNGPGWKPGHKYWGQTAEEIKQSWATNGASASAGGTTMHFDIECFMNQELVDENDQTLEYAHEDLLQIYNEEIRDGVLAPNLSEEWDFFIQFVQDFPHLKPYRTEWMIYHEDLKLAGSIDMVYENPDGTLMIYDWKRAKEITKYNLFNQHAVTQCIHYLPDTNFWHYSLQLNTYKAIIEAKYNKKVTGLFLVRLHPNNKNKTYDLIPCAEISKEVDALFALRALTLAQLAQSQSQSQTQSQTQSQKKDETEKKPKKIYKKRV